ncbi:MAG: hypothetical protein JW895_07555 [Thermoleophilaceae bacterium]|nr:hypothetical protein [Thermoleophilaceae bacterium]
MSIQGNRLPSPVTAVAVLAVLSALSLVAFTAVRGCVPEDNGLIHGCYSTRSDRMRVVEPGSGCRPGERPINWTP